MVTGDPPPPLSWPCPVLLSVGAPERFSSDVGLTILDASPESRGSVWMPGHAPCWAFTDSADGHWEEASGIIYPHFGAQPIPGFPTLAGEQWMPIRKMWRLMGRPTMEPANRCALSYRVPDEVVDSERTAGGGVTRLGPNNSWDDVRGLMTAAARVICPPSTLAYEAAAAGRLVELHCEKDHPSYPIGEAMVKAGYASWWGGHVSQKHRLRLRADGARRILEALL